MTVGHAPSLHRWIATACLVVSLAASHDARAQMCKPLKLGRAKSKEETAVVHAAQLGDLDSKLKSERTRAAAAEKDLQLAKFELVARETKIESLYAQIAELSYTVKQLQTTYTHHALFKKTQLDSSAGQTDGTVTGIDSGAYNADGIVIPKKSRFELALEPGGPGWTEEDLALLAAANLLQAPPQVQVAALAAAAAFADATKSGRMLGLPLCRGHKQQQHQLEQLIGQSLRPHPPAVAHLATPLLLWCPRPLSSLLPPPPLPQLLLLPIARLPPARAAAVRAVA